MKLTFRTLTHILIYYLLPPILAILTFVIKPRELSEALGVWAIWAFSIVMFIKPTWYFLRKTKIGFYLGKIKSYRRELGILTFWFFLFHAFQMMIKKDLFKIEYFLNPNTNIFWGALGGILLILLGITSNNISTRTLKTNWKRLQYLAYPAFIFILIHVGLAERREGLLAYGALALFFILLKIAEFWSVRKEKQKRMRAQTENPPEEQKPAKIQPKTI